MTPAADVERGERRVRLVGTNGDNRANAFANRDARGIAVDDVGRFVSKLTWARRRVEDVAIEDEIARSRALSVGDRWR